MDAQEFYHEPGTWGIFLRDVLKGLPPEDQTVFNWLYDHRNKSNHRCFPSIETLSIECGMSRPRTIKSIMRLERQHKLIQVIRTRKGMKAVNQYIITLPIKPVLRQKPQSEKSMFSVVTNCDHVVINHYSNKKNIHAPAGRCKNYGQNDVSTRQAPATIATARSLDFMPITDHLDITTRHDLPPGATPE